MLKFSRSHRFSSCLDPESKLGGEEKAGAFVSF